MIDKERLLQAVIRFGRVIGGAVIAAALLGAADLIADLELGPTIAPIALVVLTGVLNAIGKFIRGEDVPVDALPVGARTRAMRGAARETKKSFFLPF